MNFIFYLKHTSVRTKFIFFILTVFVITNIFIVIFYPLSVYNEEKRNLISHIEAELENIVTNKLDVKTTDETVYINTLFSELENVYELEYLATMYLKQKYINPWPQYSLEKINTFKLNEINYVEKKPVLSISVPVKDKTRIGVFDLKIGINAERILKAEEKARFNSFIFVIISAFIIYLFVYFFDKIIYIPLKKLINVSRLMSVGQENLEEKTVYSQEFNKIFGYLDIVARRMTELRMDNKLIPLNIKKSKEKAVQIQKSLDKEIETMSNLIIYILELRKEKTKNSIYKNLIKEITTGLGYSLCILFTNENNKLVYSRSSIKGFSVLDEKINMELKDYIISDQNSIFKEMQKHNPLLVDVLPFEDIIKKYNLSGNYALLPVNSATQFYGMIVVGNISEENKIEHKDLEKLMLISNTVALHIENIDNLTNLERNVKQRTSELETTNKLLTDSIIEKDTMLKLVSHDLNAPLRNVIGLVESIERKHKNSIDKDLEDRLSRIRKNVEKELTTIDDILNNFKFTENIDLREKVNIFQLISSIIDELSYELMIKNVRIVLDNNLPVIISNETILRHIFLNLIDNACKYMPSKKHGNKIEIKYNQQDEYNTFMVIDNGGGIDPEKQEHIFEPFKRHGNEYSDNIGKGLGLALIKNMIGKLGGDISFNSKKGQGTTFFIRLKAGNLSQGS